MNSRAKPILHVWNIWKAEPQLKLFHQDFIFEDEASLTKLYFEAAIDLMIPD